jgi:hypothetical protein
MRWKVLVISPMLRDEKKYLWALSLKKMETKNKEHSIPWFNTLPSTLVVMAFQGPCPILMA